MADVHPPATRSRNMAAIRGKDTKPELLIRRGLHKAGFRYRLHDKSLPGKPDLVFPGLRAVIFVQGCFWHGHDCALFKWPASRPEFWRAKITGNVARDAAQQAALLAMGWRVARVWDCALRGRDRLAPGEGINALAAFLRGTAAEADVRGAQT